MGDCQALHRDLLRWIREQRLCTGELRSALAWQQERLLLCQATPQHQLLAPRIHPVRRKEEENCSRLRNIGKREKRNLHSCNRLSGRSPKRVAPPWAWS